MIVVLDPKKVSVTCEDLHQWINTCMTHPCMSICINYQYGWEQIPDNETGNTKIPNSEIHTKNNFFLHLILASASIYWHISTTQWDDSTIPIPWSNLKITAKFRSRKNFNDQSTMVTQVTWSKNGKMAKSKLSQEESEASKCSEENPSTLAVSTYLNDLVNRQDLVEIIDSQNSM